MKKTILLKVLVVFFIVFTLMFSPFSFADLFGITPHTNTTAIAKTNDYAPIWPMFHYNAQHTGQCPYSTKNNNGTLKWKYQTGGRIYSSPAIASDGTIYVEMRKGDYLYYLYALKPNGTLNWKYKVGDNTFFITHPPIKGGPFPSIGPPAIAKDGTIYVGSWDLGAGNSYLYALKPNGTLKWRLETSDIISSSPAIGSDGTIYVGLENGYLYAINPNGTLKWRLETSDIISSSPAIGSDGTIYVGPGLFPGRAGYLYAINPNGTLKWKYRTGDEISSSPAISSDGTIYVGSYDWYLYAINPDGTLKWKYRTGNENSSSPAISSDGTIYVVSWDLGASDNYLYALKPNGTLKWKYRTGDGISSSPAISSDGTIFIGSDDGCLYAINPNGTLKWKFKTGGWVASPAIGRGGTIYVGSYDGYLYAIGSGTFTPPYVPANLESTSSTISITLTWSFSIQGTYPIKGYAIYKGTVHGGESNTPIATVDANTTTYTDNNVTTGTTYYYYVKAFDDQSPPNYSESSNEVNAIILNKEELINALTELKEAMLKKIDNDVDVTAMTFADVKDYRRSKRWADIFRVPLRILEDTLALPLKVKDLTELQEETNEKIRAAGDLYHVLSLVMMVNDLQKIGGKLYTAIEGPSYSIAVTKMLDAADATYMPPIDPNWKEYYKKVIVNDLQGVGEEKPLVILHKSTTPERETTAVARGALEVRINISKNFNDLINIIRKDELPSNFPLEKTINWLKKLKREVISSKLQNTDVEYDLLMNGKTWHTKINIGTVANLYKIFGNIAGILDKDLGIEQKVEILKVGESVICTIRYSTTGAVEKNLGTLQPIANVGEILLENQEKSFHSDPETEFYMVPQEMLMALPAELSNTWIIADDVNQQIRTYLQTKKIITLQIDSPSMTVNGVSQGIDPGRGTKPVIIPKWGRTVVPIRAIVEALRGTIGWNGKERKVTINFNGTVIELWIDNPKAKVNGVTEWIDSNNHDVRPIIINGRTMLPLRFVAESLGCTIKWDPITRTITITYGG